MVRVLLVGAALLVAVGAIRRPRRTPSRPAVGQRGAGQGGYQNGGLSEPGVVVNTAGVKLTKKIADRPQDIAEAVNPACWASN